MEDAIHEDLIRARAFANKSRRDPWTHKHQSTPERINRIIFDMQCVLADIADECDTVYKNEALNILHDSCEHTVEMIEDFANAEMVEERDALDHNYIPINKDPLVKNKGSEYYLFGD